MGFYPHGKPRTYSYTNRFMEVGHDIGQKAVANTKYPGLGVKEIMMPKILIHLKDIMNAARASELAFLKDTGIDLRNEATASTIFRSFNKILNSRDTFHRAMEYMRTIANTKGDMKKNQMYRDVSRFFTTYLQQAVIKNTYEKKLDVRTLNPAGLTKLINDIITEALTETYSRVNDFINKEEGTRRGQFGANAKSDPKTEQRVQAVKDMIRVIKDLGSLGIFGQYGHLFNLDLEYFQSLTRNGTGNIVVKKANYKNAHVDANFGGNILELITSVIAPEIAKVNVSSNNGLMGLNIKGVHTGQMNQMKADSILFVGEGTLNPDNYLDYVDRKTSDSVRVQNIEALDQYLNKLSENIKHVVMISDKNYSIKADFGGMRAEEKMTLAQAGETLGKFGVGAVDELISYLANCGPSMVQGDVAGDIRTTLASYIGYFLFDHLQVTGTVSGVNTVNVINASGMYLPLSVYLEGIYKSIEATSSNPTSLVSVNISLGGQTEQKVWTAGTWAAFRKSHETESFIEYKILRGIANFISNL